jgi:hypothetical protein
VPLEHPRCGTFDGGAVGDVAELVLAADLAGERAQPLFAPREQDAVPAAWAEEAYELGADPRRRTGDDGDAQEASVP